MSDDPTGTESQITLMRTIDAPVEDVFAAWTDPALLEQWQADEADVEPFAGGTYRFVSHGSAEDPGDHVVSGEYVEFVEDKRLAMSWVYRGDDDGDDDLIFFIEVEFAADPGGGTTLTLIERGASHVDAESRIFSIEAWSAAISHLAELIE